MHVTRYMTANVDERIVAMSFDAPGSGEPTPETLGTPTMASRENPGDVWGPPRELAPYPVSFEAWLAVVEGDGFKWE